MKPGQLLKQKELGDLGVAICDIPCKPSPGCLATAKFTRETAEIQVKQAEDLWQVWLSGNNHIMLSKDKANSCWGPAFSNLGPDPTNTPHSVTSPVASWAGGIDVTERGEPCLIPIKSLSKRSTAVIKAVCIQAMHKRGPHDVPLTATVVFYDVKTTD